jgi:predicted RNase H-like nuclease (RuvC/YqgF family)
MEGSEGTAAREYEETSHVNEISKATKENNLKHKTKEIAGLGKSLVEATSDKEGVQSEFDALTEYLSKLGHMCVGKASTFADRKARRDAEISGLQEAIAILEGNPTLIQRASKRSFRGKQSGVQHTKL